MYFFVGIAFSVVTTPIEGDVNPEYQLFHPIDSKVIIRIVKSKERSWCGMLLKGQSKGGFAPKCDLVRAGTLGNVLTDIKKPALGGLCRLGIGGQCFENSLQGNLGAKLGAFGDMQWGRCRLLLPEEISLA